VRYELEFYILFRRNSVSKGLLPKYVRIVSRNWFISKDLSLVSQGIVTDTSSTHILNLPTISTECCLISIVEIVPPNKSINPVFGGLPKARSP
jgi:hypothetical protein